ncbi:hypothetical protein KQX54_021729 [Cotesia glomerata]|uniref:Uncharacterized protein n=1 Tax=Cotesia glomerata TaxID=32391 RepID=A0AAV7J9Y4_COTGL|nr:hypothetical protein KQX54_021729 [Cotesia glomerata]
MSILKVISPAQCARKFDNNEKKSPLTLLGKLRTGCCLLQPIDLVRGGPIVGLSMTWSWYRPKPQSRQGSYSFSRWITNLSFCHRRHCRTKKKRRAFTILYYTIEKMKI